MRILQQDDGGDKQYTSIYISDWEQFLENGYCEDEERKKERKKGTKIITQKCKHFGY
jgi:hypothetical protein